MTYGELKVEALRIMFIAYSNNFTEANLATIAADTNYQNYLTNMPGSINRCFADIEEKRVMNDKTATLTAVSHGTFSTFSLMGVPDYFDIVRVITECGGERNVDTPFTIEGTDLVLNGDFSTCKLVYKPKITRVTSTTADSTVLNVDENIASAIPYYVKGDLYRDDEPAEAGEARNWYEAAMAQIGSKTTKRQTTVREKVRI